MSHYTRFQKSPLILRDELAIDRTLLANERTLMAYLRSGMALLIAGATMIHFSQHGWFLGLGVACIPAGFACMLLGILRFLRMNKSIQWIRRSARSGELPVSDAPSAQPGAHPAPQHISVPGSEINQ